LHTVVGKVSCPPPPQKLKKEEEEEVEMAKERMSN